VARLARQSEKGTLAGVIFCFNQHYNAISPNAHGLPDAN
jgi:hypothetical protein